MKSLRKKSERRSQNAGDHEYLRVRREKEVRERPAKDLATEPRKSLCGCQEND